MHTLRNHLAHIINGYQLIFRGVHQLIQIAEAPAQGLRHASAHVQDAQAKHQPPQVTALANL